MSVTINDIAKKAKVSSATVSRVLNNSGYVKNETRERVLKTIKETNYTPSAIARSLSKNETNTIGVIVPDITNSYFGEVIKGVSEIAENYGLNILLFNSDNSIDKEIKALNLLKEQRIKGIIMTSSFGGNEISKEYLNTIENLGIPIVLAAADVFHSNMSGVFVDNIKGAFDATNILIKEGHKEIGIITGLLSSKPAFDRLLGYKQALKLNNIEVREDYILNGDYKLESAYNEIKKLFKLKPRPTAILSCSNMMTLGAVKAIMEDKLRIPEDLALIGFDKTEILDLVGINITYVDDSTIEIGKASMNMLYEIINEKNNEVKKFTIIPRVVLKGSEKRKNS